MKNEYTAILEPPDGPENSFWSATCPEVPGANGQGDSEEDCLVDLAAAIELMLEYHRDKAAEGRTTQSLTRKVRVA